jgi:replicative DNA helicase
MNYYDPLGPTWQVQPTNIQAEMALLDGLLANNRGLDRCERLRPEHFAGEDHGAIFQAIIDGHAAGHVVDVVSLKAKFPAELLAALISSMVGIINLTDYGRCIGEAAEARDLIDIGEKLVAAARNGDQPADIAALAARRIEAITLAGASSSQWTLDAAMDHAIEAMERARNGQTAGISTGFRSFDARLGGLEPGLVYVCAGRPGMGKSSVGHQIAINVARKGVGVLELSLEMSATQLGRRTLATAARVPIMRMKSGKISNQEASQIVIARKELAGLPLTIDDTAGQSAAEIAIKARSAKRKHGLGLVMVDHLNLLRPDDHDAKHGGTWATERASATVLQIAKDCECPVLLLAQLNRGVEGREDKRPNLSDLRQAGAIEQDAYAVGFVYRPEYYMGDQPPERKPGESDVKLDARIDEWQHQRGQAVGKAEMIWAKVRDGAPGTEALRFDGPTATFSEEAPL